MNTVPPKSRTYQILQATTWKELHELQELHVILSERRCS